VDDAAAAVLLELSDDEEGEVLLDSLGAAGPADEDDEPEVDVEAFESVR
jgi:hypothetical protein